MHKDIHSDELSASVNPVTVYEICTLVDITDANVITPKKSKLKFYQSQNLNTFLQVLGLRTQILEYHVKRIKTEYSNLGFVDLEDTGYIWSLRFVAEATDPWRKGSDQLYWLKQDFYNVPIHARLKETVKLDPEMTITIDSNKINTRFNIVQNA
jgi:hypothetical protein